MRLAAALLVAATPLAAQQLALEWPLDCTLGESCFVQQYVDRDPGPEAADWSCGPLAYEGHEGTDVALPSRAAQGAGVTVLAAAAGEVTAVRDAMPDILQGRPGAPDVAGQECGNGVILAHPDGWETQYCHLAQGSVAVATGDAVAAGQSLGRVGLSGQTEFPHLHLVVRRDGVVVDPFEPSDSAACGGDAAALWADPVPYQPGGLIAAGFADAVPDYDAVQAGTAATPLAADRPLVAWGYLYGGRAGDVVRIEIRQGDDAILSHEEVLEQTQAQLYRAAGREPPPGGWPPGDYAGTVRLLRDGAEIDAARTTATISAR